MPDITGGFEKDSSLGKEVFVFVFLGAEDVTDGAPRTLNARERERETSRNFLVSFMEDIMI